MLKSLSNCSVNLNHMPSANPLVLILLLFLAWDFFMSLVNLTRGLLWVEESSTCKLCRRCGMVIWCVGRGAEYDVWRGVCLCVCVHVHTGICCFLGCRAQAPRLLNRSNVCCGSELPPLVRLGVCRPAMTWLGSGPESGLWIPATYVCCSTQVVGSTVVAAGPSTSFQRWKVSPSALTSPLCWKTHGLHSLHAVMWQTQPGSINSMTSASLTALPFPSCPWHWGFCWGACLFIFALLLCIWSFRVVYLEERGIIYVLTYWFIFIGISFQLSKKYMITVITFLKNSHWVVLNIKTTLHIMI